MPTTNALEELFLVTCLRCDYAGVVQKHQGFPPFYCPECASERIGFVSTDIIAVLQRCARRAEMVAADTDLPDDLLHVLQVLHGGKAALVGRSGEAHAP